MASTSESPRKMALCAGNSGSLGARADVVKHPTDLLPQGNEAQTGLRSGGLTLRL